jgi:hypothetical protein
MTARSTYESSVESAGPTKRDSDAAAWAAYWNTVNQANAQFLQGTITNATLISTCSAAKTTRDAALAGAVAAEMATIDVAKTTLRAAGGDNNPF